MKDFSAISVFCQDIREEVGGTESLIGIMPDNMSVPNVPGTFPMLALYTRVLITPISPKIKVGAFSFFLKFADGSEHALGDISGEKLKTALNQAVEKKDFGLGLIHKVRMAGVPIAKEGKLIVVVKHEETERISGSLNIQIQS